MAKSWEQYKVECEAVAKEGITVLGFIKPWRGCKTYLHCNCNKHGDWTSCPIDNFKIGRSCPLCKADKIRERSLQPDEIHIEKFMATGNFLKGTKFWRSDKKNSLGYRTYWKYTCPSCSNDEYVKAGVCSGVFEATVDKIKSGRISCRCSKHYFYSKEQWNYRMEKESHDRGYCFLGWSNDKFGNCAKLNYSCPEHGIKQIRARDFIQGQGCAECSGYNQKEAYVNIVYDGDNPVCLKFGVTNKTERRLKQQNMTNVFLMKNILVYEFEEMKNSRLAEKFCLSELDCAVVSKSELKDGWTETTSLTNLDKIVEIYQRFGGIKIK